VDTARYKETFRNSKQRVRGGGGRTFKLNQVKVGHHAERTVSTEWGEKWVSDLVVAEQGAPRWVGGDLKTREKKRSPYRESKNPTGFKNKGHQGREKHKKEGRNEEIQIHGGGRGRNCWTPEH